MSGAGDDDTLNGAVERTMVTRAPVFAAAPADIVHAIAYDDAGTLRRVTIGPGGLAIGRTPPADLVIARPDVSRRHCRIDIDGAAATITDLGSTNGTFVGGRRLARPVRLRNGATVTVGGAALRYEQRDRRAVEEEAELAGELREAVDYVRAILPEPIATGPVQADWWFAPCSRLGGDAFGYDFLDDATLTGFVLDVSGHGIGAALHAVNVANALRRRTLPGVDFRDPAAIAAAVNAAFPMEAHNGLMLTLFLFTYDVPGRTLRFCSAGHHPALLLAPGTAEPQALWQKGPAIGMLPHGRWTAGTATVAPGSRLYVFSDGAFEVLTEAGTDWGLDGLRRAVAAPARPDVPEAQRLYHAVRAAARPGPLPDDLSVLVLHLT
jgi:serine phosphatase RsbU (regulator of sigma subunit)